MSTSPSNIPADAVEAAATHLYPGWETSPADWKDYFRRKATEALEAAAPYMLDNAKAEALIEAAEVAERGEGGGYDSGECDDWGAWLRARAANVRAVT